MNQKYKNRKTVIKGFLCYLHILILCLSSIVVYGQQQTYPVQVFTQLIPPYTPHIPAYYTGTQPKLKVTLINTDMQKPLVNVYLRIKILSSSFSLITPPEVYTPQIELQAGMPLSLSLNDLEAYFKRDNLRVSGGQAEFYRTQMLPDNFYRFNFEVYEVGTNRLVSNTKLGFAQAMIAAGEPPILNLPQKGSVIKESNIPNIMFSWTPKHMNSMAAAYGVEYEISLVEIYDKQVAPEAAFEYSRILYTETTKSTSFIHTAALPMLLPGMRYAWRVQVKAREGVDEISIFKNNGYSPVSWFDYTADCKTVQSCGAVFEEGHINITWQDAGASDYTVEYRKKGTTKWYTGIIGSPLLSQLYNLEQGKEYEYRIGSRCVTGDAFQYNKIQAFRIPNREENRPNCGLMPDITLTNQTPTRELQSGMPVLVGDFPVFITKVSGSGRFSGEGYVGIPYLQGAQIAVTFKDIVVNTDNRLVTGFFETKYDTKNNNLLFDGDQHLSGGKGVGDIRTGEEKAAFKVDYTINPSIKAKPLNPDNIKDDITQSESYTIIKGENSEYYEIYLNGDSTKAIKTKELPVTIEDKEGNTYEVNEKGEVKPVSKNSDIKLDPATKDTQSDVAALSFKATDKTKYALDEYKDIYEKVTEYKDQYKLEGTAITASAKFMLPGVSDEITVYIKENEKNKLVPEKVRFVTGKGKEYEAKYDPQSRQWNITIVAGGANDGQELYAVQDMGDGKYETLGKLNIYTYEPKNVNVKLVPVNNNRLDIDLNQVNKIYKKIGIELNIDVADNFDYPELQGRQLKVTGSGLFSMLTDDMKVLNDAYTSHLGDKYDGGTYYLFMLDGADAKEKQAPYGDMPQGKQFGYLFNGASEETVAHELGHGVFNLEHPFSRTGRNSFPEDSLHNNLMHYYNGIDLAKLQWDQTRAPGNVIGLFQKDKDGMSIKQPELRCIADASDLGKIFVAPNGDYVKLTSEQVPYAFFAKSEGKLYGRLAAYKYNNKIYIYYLEKATYTGFWGWVGLGGQNEATNLKQLAASSQKGLLVEIDDECNYGGRKLEDCNCSFIGNKKKDTDAAYTEGGRPTIVATGNQDELPCVALPENQDKITVEYLEEKLYHKRMYHCLEDLNVEKRKELIAKIAGQQIIVGADEDILFKLFFSTPQKQEDAIFTHLKDNDLISIILNNTQLTTHDEIAFVFIGWLRNQKDKFPITDNTKAVNFNKGDINSDISGNTITLKFDWVSEMGYTDEPVGLYEYILVYFEDDAGSYKKGSLLKIPALEAYYLFNADRRESLIKSGKLALDVSLMALGVGEITAAYRVYQGARGAYALYLVIKASADMGVGMTDIVIQHSLAEEWNKTPEGRARLERWNTICTWYTIGSLSASAVDLAISKFGRSIDSESKFDDICDELEDIAGGGNRAGRITSTDELIRFLDSVDETTTIVQLEERGINVLFRGTTRNSVDNSLFLGNPNTIANGISTSTDPIRSTIFAIESATLNGGSRGVLQMALPENLHTLGLLSPNRRVGIELEVVIETSADSFSKLSNIEISVDEARKLVKEVYGIDLPTRLTRDDATYLLETIKESSLEDAFKFYQRIIK